MQRNKFAAQAVRWRLDVIDRRRGQQEDAHDCQRTQVAAHAAEVRRTRIAEEATSMAAVIAAAQHDEVN